jgi:hypothetical protein
MSIIGSDFFLGSFGLDKQDHLILAEDTNAMGAESFIVSGHPR